MPDFVCIFGKLEASDLDAAAVIEQAELNAFRMGGKEGKVRALSIEARAETVPFARRDMKMRALGVHLIL
jgi:hypothetical protein